MPTAQVAGARVTNGWTPDPSRWRPAKSNPEHSRLLDGYGNGFTIPVLVLRILGVSTRPATLYQLLLMNRDRRDARRGPRIAEQSPASDPDLLVIGADQSTRLHPRPNDLWLWLLGRARPP